MFKELNPRIYCNDGFNISVQGSSTAYALPREDDGPYTHVECGFPSENPGYELMEFAENSGDPTGTVYGYVPVDVVMRVLFLHGGIAKGKMP